MSCLPLLLGPVDASANVLAIYMSSLFLSLLPLLSFYFCFHRCCRCRCCCSNLVAEVTCAGAKIYGAGNPVKVLAVDCGMKHHMIRMLVDRGAEVKVVPWDWDLASEREWYDGLFISNGPGDPSVLKPLIAQLRSVINLPGKPKPIFGICLGNQLLGLAAGATAFKLPFGNRGHNQPVVNTLTGEAYITSQNHGFAIDTSTLSGDWAPLFVNANDGTNEGIMHTSKPFWSAQFHPGA